MKYIILFSLVLVTGTFAQTGEMTPEQLKKIEQREAAAKARVEEQKRIEAENKKKADVEATTRWLISERDRKMKEAAEAEARKSPPPVKAHEPQTIVDGLKGTPHGDTRVRKRLPSPGTGYPVKIYPEAPCAFPAGTKFPSDVKVFGIGTYEGTFPGGRGFQHHPMTDVTLNVEAQGPVALVIWTYEPVRWAIKMNGGNLVGVLVIGYHKQKLAMDNEVPSIVSFYENGKNQCQYSENSHDQTGDYSERAKFRLSKFSQSLFGKELTSYQFKYSLPAEVTVKEN